MRKIVLALAAVAAIGIALPVVTAPAEAYTKKVVIIKKNKHWHHGRHYDRGHHYGWRNHGQHRHGATVVVR